MLTAKIAQNMLKYVNSVLENNKQDKDAEFTTRYWNEDSGDLFLKRLRSVLSCLPSTPATNTSAPNKPELYLHRNRKAHFTVKTVLPYRVSSGPLPSSSSHSTPQSVCLFCLFCFFSLSFYPGRKHLLERLFPSEDLFTFTQSCAP